MNINNKIKMLREQKGISQYRMAEDIGLSRSIIVNWELGRTTPNVSHLNILSTYFNIPVDELTNSNELKVTTEECLLEMIESYYRTHEFSDNARLFQSLNELFVESVESNIKK